ncbi:hypothetical protein TrCOL_g12550 [Triparma columacea]|uniref:RanBP2-type domain-containing protein n=1 Tax=Triparma columacea TaxID=722753 RepID=A0A9W7GJF9_9STRA|nr:hypothetical protein TrCOL_g12550 [Triparma columacea]
MGGKVPKRRNDLMKHTSKSTTTKKKKKRSSLPPDPPPPPSTQTSSRVTGDHRARVASSSAAAASKQDVVDLCDSSSESDSGTDWSCQTCTFNNASNRLNCAICGVRKVSTTDIEVIDLFEDSDDDNTPFPPDDTPFPPASSSCVSNKPPAANTIMTTDLTGHNSGDNDTPPPPPLPIKEIAHLQARACLPEESDIRMTLIKSFKSMCPNWASFPLALAVLALQEGPALNLSDDNQRSALEDIQSSIVTAHSKGLHFHHPTPQVIKNLSQSYGLNPSEVEKIMHHLLDKIPPLDIMYLKWMHHRLEGTTRCGSSPQMSLCYVLSVAASTEGLDYLKGIDRDDGHCKDLNMLWRDVINQAKKAKVKAVELKAIFGDGIAEVEEVLDFKIKTTEDKEEELLELMRIANETNLLQDIPMLSKGMLLHRRGSKKRVEELKVITKRVQEELETAESEEKRVQLNTILTAAQGELQKAEQSLQIKSNLGFAWNSQKDDKGKSVVAVSGGVESGKRATVAANKNPSLRTPKEQANLDLRSRSGKKVGKQRTVAAEKILQGETLTAKEDRLWKGLKKGGGMSKDKERKTRENRGKEANRRADQPKAKKDARREKARIWAAQSRAKKKKEEKEKEEKEKKEKEEEERRSSGL